jgi:hypothetical protein
MDAEGFGELTLTTWRTDDGEFLWVDRADPRILISRQILGHLLLMGGGPHADLRPGSDAPVVPVFKDPALLRDWCESAMGYMEGWLLTVKGGNRTVLYRIGELLPHLEAYAAEWPD